MFDHCYSCAGIDKLSDLLHVRCCSAKDVYWSVQEGLGMGTAIAAWWAFSCKTDCIDIYSALDILLCV